MCVDVQCTRLDKVHQITPPTADAHHHIARSFMSNLWSVLTADITTETWNLDPESFWSSESAGLTLIQVPRFINGLVLMHLRFCSSSLIQTDIYGRFTNAPVFFEDMFITSGVHRILTRFSYKTNRAEDLVVSLIKKNKKNVNTGKLLLYKHFGMLRYRKIIHFFEQREKNWQPAGGHTHPRRWIMFSWSLCLLFPNSQELDRAINLIYNYGLI